MKTLTITLILALALGFLSCATGPSNQELLKQSFDRGEITAQDYWTLKAQMDAQEAAQKIAVGSLLMQQGYLMQQPKAAPLIVYPYGR